VALNSETSFWARVLDTVRAQNWTVPVALTPKFGEPGVLEVAPEEDEAEEEAEADAEAAEEEAADELLLELGEEEDEHPAAAASTRAVAEKAAMAAGLRIFMCCSFRRLRKKVRRVGWHGSADPRRPRGGRRRLRRQLRRGPVMGQLAMPR
jgi:hypothetical protein